MQSDNSIHFSVEMSKEANSQLELFEPYDDDSLEFQHETIVYNKPVIPCDTKTYKKGNLPSDIESKTESELGTSGSEYVPSDDQENDCDSTDESDISEFNDSSYSHEKKSDISLSQDSDFSLDEENSNKTNYLQTSSEYNGINSKNHTNASLIKSNKVQKKLSIGSTSKQLFESIIPEIPSDEEQQCKFSYSEIVRKHPNKKTKNEVIKKNNTDLKAKGCEKMNNNLEKSLEVSKQVDTEKNNVRNESFNEMSELSGISSLENSFVNINLKSVGEALRNKNINTVLCSTDGCKKNCCYFCVKKALAENDTRIVVHKTKLPDHYNAKHSKEKAVVKLKKLQDELDKLKKKHYHGETKIKQQELISKKKKIFDMLRIKANHLNNLNSNDASKYVLRRRPHNSGKLLSRYLPCFKCTQVYSENSLRKHVRKCTGLTFKKNHEIKSRARATNGDYHKSATELSIKIISKMRETAALEQIRYDTAVFVWLNAEASRTETKKHIHPRVRASLSRLGTLLMEIKKMNEKIDELSDVFHEDNYEILIEAIKVMGKPNPDTAFMQSPATANDMFNLIKHVSEIYEIWLGSKNQEIRSQVQAFVRKFTKMWQYSIGTTIIETQARNRRNNAIDLPDDSDTMLLNNYLKQEMSDSYQQLKTSYNDHEYERLRNALCCYLQSINARRPGEVERLEMQDYDNIKTSVTDCLIIPRGKRRRGVPVVFDIQEKPYLDMLKACRPKAKISEKNPYFFATIHDIGSTDFGHISACRLMNRFSVLCQAKRPETLRGTRFRMKVATDGMEKGLNQTEVQQLADFLGHTPRIHNQNYRQSVFDLDVAVSRKVRAAQGIHGHEKNGSPHAKKKFVAENEENSENYECNQSILEQSVGFVNPTDEQNVDVNTEKTGSSSTVTGRPSRLAWKKPQIDILLAHFPNALDLKHKVPSVSAINNFIASTKDPILQMRTEPQIRSWFHVQRNEKKSGSHLPERDRIPNYIYSAFQKYIDAGKTPSLARCAKFLSQSPSKSNITISNIQNWVILAIKNKNC